MSPLAAQINPIRDRLLRVGFLNDRFQVDAPIPGCDWLVSLLAFSDRPFDSRTATIAAIQARSNEETAVAALRPLGAALVFVCQSDHYQLWKQESLRPRFYRRLSAQQLPRFFDEHRQELAPDSLYRAKVWGRLDHSFQLEFVDAGLLPLVEEEAGRKLTELVERVVQSTKRQLGWQKISDADGRWLLQATFWLLASKILQDKRVQGFVRLNLTDVELVYARLAGHSRPARIVE